VQLIQEATLGGGRFEPFGPPPPPEGGPREASRPDANPSKFCLASSGAATVHAKPSPCPADTDACEAHRLRLTSDLPETPEVTREIEVHRVIEVGILPTHVVGSLLDVLA
jgi:hypothetical protein